jgi:hypothetical protein
MKTKRIALLLALLFTFALFLAACGDADTPTDPVDPNGGTTENGSSGGLDYVPPPPPAEAGDPPAGAIDFADGQIGWAAVNLAPGDADPAELSVVTHHGRGALKVTLTEGKTPYLGIDVSSLYGDRLTDIRSIELRLWLDCPDKFYAASGALDVFTGTANDQNEVGWAVTLERNNPTVIKADLNDMGASFALDSKNIIVLRKGTGGDAAVRAGDRPSNFIIDYIIAYDASGNVIPADTSTFFSAPRGFGSADMTLLFEVDSEVRFSFLDDNKTGTSSSWGQAGAIDRENFDLDILVPGSVITVGYGGPKAPELIFQSWSDGPVGWAKVDPFMVNISGTVAQYRYEDVVEAFGTDNFEDYLDRVYVGDRDSELEVKSFSIGMRTHEIEYRSVLMGDPGFIDITHMQAIVSGGSFIPFRSDHAWQLNFRANTTIIPDGDTDAAGEFRPGWLVPGAFITAFYSSDEGTQFCLQRYAIEGGAREIFTGANPGSDPNSFSDPSAGIDQSAFEDLLSAWQLRDGTLESLYTELNVLWIQNRGSPMDLFNVILYTPNPSGEIE